MQTTINITMSVGLLPVVGLPLPLLSYGGSSLIVTYLGFGIIAGYKRRR
jgi:cell division protein FtsW (lipid II flippase)